jgi:acetyl esterase/lipase
MDGTGIITGWSLQTESLFGWSRREALGRTLTQTPPTFLLQSEDDDVDSIEDALSYYMGLKAAKVPVELHPYAQGGHAFGLRPSKLPVSEWPQLVEKWLGTIGIIAQ